MSDGLEYELRAPTEAPTYDLHEAREKALVDWRLLCFCNLGLHALHAGVLAIRRDIDRVAVERLAKAGASSSQIVAILT